MTLPEDFANQRDILADKMENLEIGSHTWMILKRGF